VATPLEPAWAGAGRGGIRIAVIAVAALAGACFFLLDPADELVSAGPFWAILFAGAGGGAAVSAARAIALPAATVLVSATTGRGPAAAAGSGSTRRGAASSRGAARPGRRPVAWTAITAQILRRTAGDAVWAIVVLTVAMLARAVIAGLTDRWSAESLRSVIVTPFMSLILFAAVLLGAWLLIVAARSVAEFFRRRAAGQEVPAAAWWAVAAIASIALALPALLGLGLSDASSVPLEGSDAIGQFFFGEIRLGQWWQYALLWTARVGLLAVPVCLIAVVVARAIARRRG
jgi:hypothetical protein